MKEFNHVPLFNFLSPQICWNVNHCTQQLQQQISVLVSVMSQLYVPVHVLLKRVNRLRVELSDVPTDFEQQSVSKLESSLNKLFMLVVLGNNLCIARVGSQVDSQCDQFLAYYWFRTVDDKLINKRDTFCICKCRLKLVLLRKVVKQFKN